MRTNIGLVAVAFLAVPFARALADNGTSLVTPYQKTFTRTAGNNNNDGRGGDDGQGRNDGRGNGDGQGGGDDRGGDSQRFTDSFTVPTTTGQFWITVESENMTAAEVFLNGTRVWGPTDFTPPVTTLRASVAVTTSNSIEVRLEGKPGEQAFVHVDGVVPDSAIPPSYVNHCFQDTFFTQTFTAQPHATSTQASFTMPTVAGLYWLDISGPEDLLDQTEITWNGSRLIALSAPCFLPFFEHHDQGSVTISVPVLVQLTDTVTVQLPGTHRDPWWFFGNGWLQGNDGQGDDGGQGNNWWWQQPPPNESVTLSVHGYAVDNTPPTIQLVSPTTQETASSSTPLLITYQDAISGVSSSSVAVVLNGQDVTSSLMVTPSQASAPLGQLQPSVVAGANVVQVQVADLAGNVATATFTFQFAVQAPGLAITSPTEGAISGPSGTSFEIDYAGDSFSAVNVSTLAVTLDGTNVTNRFSVGPSSATATIAIPVGGPHVLAATIANTAGAAAAVTRNFSVQTHGPLVSFEPTGVTGESTPAIYVLYSDPPPGAPIDPTTLTLLLDGSPIPVLVATPTIAVAFPPSPLQAGLHLLSATVSDQVGNQTTQTGSFTVDLGTTHFGLSIAPSASSSVAVLSLNNLTIQALDSHGVVDPNYTGLVTLSSTAGGMTLNGMVVQFFPADQGVVTISGLAIVQNVGPQTVTATSADTPAITGSLTLMGVSAVPSWTPPVVGADGSTTISGNAVLANATVQILVDGTVVATTQSDASGNFSVSIVLPPGAHSVVVTATANGITLTSVTQVMGPPATLVGQVLNGITVAGTALPGVMVTVEGGTLSATTDANGKFTIANVPAGDQVLDVNGTAVGMGYMRVHAFVSGTTDAGAITLRTPGPTVTPSISSGQASAFTITNPSLLTSVSIAAGPITLPAGAPATFSVNPVMPGDLPTVLPVEAAGYIAFSIQPEGAVVGSATITFPNDASLNPGDQAPVWRYVPETGNYEQVGTAVANADASALVFQSDFITGTYVVQPSSAMGSLYLFAVLVEEPDGKTLVPANQLAIGCAGLTQVSQLPSSAELQRAGQAPPALGNAFVLGVRGQPGSETIIRATWVQPGTGNVLASATLPVTLSASTGLINKQPLVIRFGLPTSVSGTVVDFNESLPVNGAQVRLLDAVTSTDQFGHFSITSVQTVANTTTTTLSVADVYASTSVPVTLATTTQNLNVVLQFPATTFTSTAPPQIQTVAKFTGSNGANDTQGLLLNTLVYSSTTNDLYMINQALSDSVVIVQRNVNSPLQGMNTAVSGSQLGVIGLHREGINVTPSNSNQLWVVEGIHGNVWMVPLLPNQGGPVLEGTNLNNVQPPNPAIPMAATYSTDALLANFLISWWQIAPSTNQTGVQPAGLQAAPQTLDSSLARDPRGDNFFMSRPTPGNSSQWEIDQIFPNVGSTGPQNNPQVQATFTAPITYMQITNKLPVGNLLPTIYAIRGGNNVPMVGWGGVEVDSIDITNGGVHVTPVYSQPTPDVLFYGLTLAPTDVGDIALYVLQSNLTDATPNPTVSNIEADVLQIRIDPNYVNLYPVNESGTPDQNPDPAGDGFTNYEKFIGGINPNTFTPVTLALSQTSINQNFTTTVQATVSPPIGHPTITSSNPSLVQFLVGGKTASSIANFTGGPLTLVASPGFGQIQILVSQGGVQEQPVTLTLVDTIPPTISIAPSSGFVPAQQNVAVSYSDPISGINASSFFASLNSQNVSASFSANGSTATATLGPLTNGTVYSLVASIADNAGNIATATVTYTADTVPPAISTTLTPSFGGYTSASPTVTATITDKGSGVNVSSFAATLDSSPISTSFTRVGTSASSTWSAVLAPLQDGTSHTVVFDAQDSVGNVAPPSTLTFKIDALAPTLAIVTPGAYSTSSTVPVSITYSDSQSGVNVASFTVMLDGKNVTSQFPFVTSAGATAVFTGLANGSHTLAVTVLDNVSNKASVTQSFIVDTTPPTLAIVAPTSGQSVTDVLQPLQVMFSDAISGINTASLTASLVGTPGTLTPSYVDGASATFFPQADLSTGLHTYQVSFSNLAGLTATASVTFRVAPQPGAVFYTTTVPEPQQNPSIAAAGVILSNGQFGLARTYLTVPGRGELGYLFALVYKSYIQSNSVVGQGWTHNFDMRLSRLNATTLQWLTGTGRLETLVLQPDGTYIDSVGQFVRVTGANGAFWGTDATGYTIRTPDELQFIFNPLSGRAPGAINTILDAHGNHLIFSYDSSGRLTTVKDPFDQVYTYAYGPGNLLASVTDYTGRQIKLQYSLQGDLTKITDVVITKTTTGVALSDPSLFPDGANSFPNGRSEIFEYTSGSTDVRLNHKMTKVFAPNEAASYPNAPARITNVWNLDGTSVDAGRLVNQIVGGTNASGQAAGGTYAFVYTQVNPPPTDPVNGEFFEVTVTDRNTNVTDVFHNQNGQCVRKVQHTRGVRPASGPVQDPPSYTTTRQYNPDGLAIGTQFPMGNQVSMAYDSQSPLRTSQANPLSKTMTPDARGDSVGGMTSRTITYTSEPIFNHMRTVTDERGNDPAFVPQNDPSNTRQLTNATRFQSVRFFDYQQTATIARLSALSGIPQATLTTALANAGVQLGLGDINGDSSDDAFAAGDPVKIQNPSVTLVGAQTLAQTLEAGTVQPNVTFMTFNVYGEPTRVQDAENNVHTFTYNPSYDPTGSGTRVPGTTQTDTTGGYLASQLVDAQSDLAREGLIAIDPTSFPVPGPAQLLTKFSYDTIGDVTGVTDGRGITHQFDYTPARELVRTLAATTTSGAYLPQDQALPALAYSNRNVRDANGNVVEDRVGNQGERTGDGAFVGGNTYWSTVRVLDILDMPVTVIREVKPIPDGVAITPQSVASLPAGTVTVAQLGYDPNQNLTKITKPMQNVVAVTFDERDLVFTVTRGQGDSLASATSRYYDLNGNLRFFVDGVKNDPALNTSFTAGDVTQLLFDGFDRLKGKIDAENNQTAIVYDPASHPVRTRRSDASGNRLAESMCFFDELGRGFQWNQVVFAPGAPQVPFDLSIPTIATTPQGVGDQFAVSTRDFDRLGRTVRSVDTKQADVLANYDGAGRRVLFAGPKTGFSPSFDLDEVRSETASFYDGASNLLRTIELARSPLSLAAGQSSHDSTITKDYVRDAVGRVTEYVGSMAVLNSSNQPVFEAQRSYFDSRSNVIAQTDAKSSGTPVALPQRNNVLINADGNVTRAFYDGISRQVQVERFLHPGGQGDGSPHLTDTDAQLLSTGIVQASVGSPTGIVTTKTDYDLNSRVTFRTDANGHMTGFGYDALDRGNMEVFADLTTQQTDYDADDNPIQTTDPNGTIIKNIFDALNRRVKSNVTKFGPGVVGTTFQAFSWDGLSRLIGTADDNGGSGMCGPGGVVCRYLWDSLSRRLQESQTVNAVLTDKGGTVKNGDGLATVGQAAVPGVTTTHTVNSGYTPLPTPSGVQLAFAPVMPVRTSLQYPDGQTLNYAVDNANRIQEISPFNLPVFTQQTTQTTLDIATYQWVGYCPECCQREHGNGTATTYTYYKDCFLCRVLQLIQSATGIPLMTLNESYDANEQRSTEQKTGTPDPTFSYVYDSLNRVTGVTITPDVGSATTTSYQFDGANNFVQQSAGGTTTNYNSMAGAYAPDLLNRYLSIQTISGTTTTTDARMSAPRRTRPRRPCRTPAAFDAFHRLVTVNTQPSGSLQAGSGCYLYDATGRRVARFAHLPNGAQVQSVIVWDGPQEIEEYGSAPTSAPTARYVYGAADVDELVEFEPNPLAQGHPVYYYQQDLQESILGLTDSSGNVVEQYSYTSIYGVHAVSTPGGNPEPIEGAIGNPFRFQGHRLDPESGLIFFRNRYLDPVEGRFVNRDPIGIWGDPSASGNGYAFCGGNPVNRRDPFGLDDNVDPQDQNAWGGNNGGHWEIHIQWNFFGNYIKNVTVGGFIGAYECGKKALQGDPIGAGVDMGKGIVLMPVNWYNAMNNASTQTKAGNYDEANRQAATAASIAATPAVMIFTPRIVGYLKGQAISVISKASQAWETLDFGCKGQLLALAGTGEAFVNAVARGDEAVGGGMVMRPAGKTVTGVAVLNGVMQMAGEGRDLITTGRQTHILSGDQTGGGHRPGTGIPGKSEFPAGWTDDQILDTITDIATDPASTRTPSFGGRTVVTGTRNGIDIRVIVDANGNVVSGYPTNVPRNP